MLAELTVEATPAATRRWCEFANEHSGLRAWAIEGTGSHGAGLARHLGKCEELVVELDRPERQKRRNGAKSDPLDAIRAAREALVSDQARHAADDRRTPGTLGAFGSQTLGSRRREGCPAAALLPRHRRPRAAAFEASREAHSCDGAERSHGLHLRAEWDLETRTTAAVLRDLPRRALELWAEADRQEKEILAIVRAWRPELLELCGVGPIVAATVLCAWSHPGRIRSEAAFAMLGGAAPIPANSGQVTTHYRLNRLRRPSTQPGLPHHRALPDALGRGHQDLRQATHSREGKTPREIKRCLKRYVARELFRLLESGPVCDLTVHRSVIGDRCRATS